MIERNKEASEIYIEPIPAIIIEKDRDSLEGFLRLFTCEDTDQMNKE